LLARYDGIIEYDRQSRSYRDRPVRILDKGHATAAISFADLRRHILDSMTTPTPH